MKKVLAFTLMAAILYPMSAFAKKKDKEGLVPNYQVEGAGMLDNNAVKVCVTVYADRKDKVTDDDFAKCAVHGVLFRDFSDATNAGQGMPSTHYAIMKSPSAETEHFNFFEPFFTEGDAMKYTQVISDTRRVVKSGKKWKISTVVTVNTSALRSDLKNQHLVKDLGSGW